MERQTDRQDTEQSDEINPRSDRSPESDMERGVSTDEGVPGGIVSHVAHERLAIVADVGRDCQPIRNHRTAKRKYIKVFNQGRMVGHEWAGMGELGGVWNRK